MSGKKGDKNVPTQIKVHSMRNILGNPEHLDVFCDYKDQIEGLILEDIDRFGIDLTDLQLKVMEGILNALTRTHYQGNMTPKSIENSPSEEGADIYKNIIEIPRIRATQKEVLEWAGFDQINAGEKERALSALHHLANARFCFYYERLAYDTDGKPIKDRRGRWSKEEVVSVDSLFDIKIVHHSNSKKIKYYEIAPSWIFLDQRENYYVMIPQEWREEVQRISGKKNKSPYIPKFLMFLRFQYERMRRSGRGIYELKHTPEEFANAIKMPRSTIKRNKPQVHRILDEAYSIAKKAGYLIDYKRTEACDILYLNDSKYHHPDKKHIKPEEHVSIEKEEKTPEERAQAMELFDFFYGEKKKRDPCLNIPKGVAKNKQIEEIIQLLKQRTIEDVQKVIQWGFDLSFWCEQISTPAKLRKKFGDAWLEMQAFKKKDPEMRVQENKALAKDILKKLRDNSSSVKIELLNQDLEVRDGNYEPTILGYNDKHFKAKLLTALKKRRVAFAEEL